MARIRRINVSQIEGNDANNTSEDEIRPYGEIGLYEGDYNSTIDRDRLELLIFDGKRVHLKSKVLSPGVFYGSNADSGDGYGLDTIKLIPDAALHYNSGSYGNDQYLIVDPTAPNHIHIRAGGTIDQSNADLFLGGELTNIRVSDAYDNVIIKAYSGLGDVTRDWTFSSNGSLTLPSQGNVVGTTANNSGSLQWIGASSGDGLGFTTLVLRPDDMVGADQHIVIDPTAPNHIHIRAGGTQDDSGAQLFLGGETSHFSVGAGLNPPLYLKANNYQWTMGTDGVLTLPAGGDIHDSTGTSVLGGATSYNDLTDKPTIPTDVSDLTDTTSLLSGGGTTLPADASGYLNNDGSGTLAWVPGNPSGSGLLPYSDVKVISNTTTADWTEFTLSGTMDSMYDFGNSIAAITLTSATAYGKTITANTKNLWVANAKINSTDNLVVEFPPNPTLGDIFSVVPVAVTQTVTAGSFVIGETYTIVSIGTTNFTAIGAAMNGIGQTFTATGAGSGTGTASTSAGAKKLIYKPSSGQRARTMSIGSNLPVMFGQGGTYDFMYVDLSSQYANQPATWVYAGLIDSIPTWYHTYF